MKLGSERNLYDQAELLSPSESLWDRLSHRVAAESGWDSSVSSPSRSPPEPEWHEPEPEWDEVAPGISCRLISTDDERDRVSMLVRLAQGAAYPAHRHAGVEELFLLYGELWIDDRKLRAGDYNRAQAGSVDKRVWSERGCTCLLITSLADLVFDPDDLCH